jgi:hypothetical protein
MMGSQDVAPGARIDRFFGWSHTFFDGDLAYEWDSGIAWQTDRAHIVDYDAAYYAKCAANDSGPIADEINAARIGLVARWYSGRLIDVGVGGGAFVRRRPDTFGWDVNPAAVEMLKREGKLATDIEHFGAVSMWDVIEHLPDPGFILDRVQLHSYLFVSLPIFESLDVIRTSRHYRPGEHLQYWTRDGFGLWAAQHGFAILECNAAETEAGRDGIVSFALKRKAWPKRTVRSGSTG